MRGNEDGDIYLEVCCDDEIVILDIYDQGCGIEDIDLAMQPLYTSREDLERSGMGFTIMQSFADVLSHRVQTGRGHQPAYREETAVKLDELSNEALIEAIQQGCDEAKDVFVERNQPLVYAMAKRFAPAASLLRSWCRSAASG